MTSNMYQSLQDMWLWNGFCFTVLFFTLMTGFSILDHFNPPFWQKYAIGERKPFHWPTIKQTVLPTVIKNMLFSFVFMTCLWSIRIYYTDNIMPWKEYTGWGWGLIQWLLCYTVSEMAFTFNHWLAHTYSLDFHKKHHKFNKPFAICSFYCGFEEMILMNLPVAQLGPLLFLVNPNVHLVWLLMAGTYVSFDHCGHQIGPRFVFDAAYHDFHHSHPSDHHGSHLLDRIVGNLKV